MVVSDEIRSLILRKASGDEIAAAAVAAGMRRLRDDGLEKVRQGITSVPRCCGCWATPAPNSTQTVDLPRCGSSLG